MKPELQTAVETLGLEKFRRHIFLCADPTEPKCCPREAGLASWEFLKRRLKELNLVGPEPLVYRTKANCLRVCVRGPMAVVYPEGVWYHALHAGSSGAHHPGTFDRRKNRRGICVRKKSAAMNADRKIRLDISSMTITLRIRLWRRSFMRVAMPCRTRTDRMTKHQGGRSFRSRLSSLRQIQL